MTTKTLAESPAGPIEQVPNLKKRQTSIYWRPHVTPDGETIWIETLPLPSDLQGRETYLAKGFRLSPPQDEVPPLVVVDEEKERLYAEVASLHQQLEEAKSLGDGRFSRKTESKSKRGGSSQ